MNIDKILQINARVEISSNSGQDEGEQIWGKSLIQAVDQDTFSIMVPVKDGHTLYLAEGDRVSGLLFADGARYAFQSVVTGKQEVAGVRYVVLKKPLRLNSSERRNLVRIRTLLSIRYEIIAADEEEFWENTQATKEVTVINFSGKGVCITHVNPIPPETTLVMEIPLYVKRTWQNLKLMGRVVRCEKNGGLYRIGVKFLQITDSQENLIMKYVSETQRKYIQVNKDDGL